MSESDFRCPGQNTMFWKPDDIYDVTCPSCGRPVEFWKDDAKRTCKCGHRFHNPKRDIGCLEWCKYAEQCMPEMFQGDNFQALYRDRLLAAVRKVLGLKVDLQAQVAAPLEFLDELIGGEKAQPKVAIAALVLKVATAAATAEPVGAGTLRKIMAEVGTEPEVMNRVTDLVLGTGPAHDNGPEARVVADALELAQLAAKKALLGPEAMAKQIATRLQSETAKRLASEQLQ